jgi:hypothetical protein
VAAAAAEAEDDNQLYLGLKISIKKQAEGKTFPISLGQNKFLIFYCAGISEALISLTQTYFPFLFSKRLI